MTPPDVYGDRSKLDSDQYAQLQKVLTTAKRWVQNFPELARHGEQTLRYWREPIPFPNVLPRRERDAEDFR